MARPGVGELGPVASPGYGVPDVMLEGYLVALQRPNPRWFETRVPVTRIGIAALVICVAFATLILVLTTLGINDVTMLSVAVAVVVMFAHLVAYVAMLAALLASRRVGAVPAGRFGRRAFAALRWSLTALIVIFISGTVIVVVPALAAPIGAVISLVFLVAHLMATVYGLALWRGRTTSMLTAALFTAVVPTVLLMILLNAIGIRVFPAVFEAVMALAFASLSYELAFGRRAATA